MDKAIVKFNFIFNFISIFLFPSFKVPISDYKSRHLQFKCHYALWTRRKKEVIVNMDSGVFLTQKSRSSSSSYIAAGSGWAGWACAHPDFARVDKRTETEVDNILLFVR